MSAVPHSFALKDGEKCLLTSAPLVGDITHCSTSALSPFDGKELLTEALDRESDALRLLTFLSNSGAPLATGRHSFASEYPLRRIFGRSTASDLIDPVRASLTFASREKRLLDLTQRLLAERTSNAESLRLSAEVLPGQAPSNDIRLLPVSSLLVLPKRKATRCDLAPSAELSDNQAWDAPRHLHPSAASPKDRSDLKLRDRAGVSAGRFVKHQRDLFQFWGLHTNPSPAYSKCNSLGLLADAAADEAAWLEGSATQYRTSSFFQDGGQHGIRGPASDDQVCGDTRVGAPVAQPYTSCNTDPALQTDRKEIRSNEPPPTVPSPSTISVTLEQLQMKTEALGYHLSNVLNEAAACSGRNRSTAAVVAPSSSRESEDGYRERRWRRKRRRLVRQLYSLGDRSSAFCQTLWECILFCLYLWDIVILVLLSRDIGTGFQHSSAICPYPGPPLPAASTETRNGSSLQQSSISAGISSAQINSQAQESKIVETFPNAVFWKALDDATWRLEFVASLLCQTTSTLLLPLNSPGIVSQSPQSQSGTMISFSPKVATEESDGINTIYEYRGGGGGGEETTQSSSSMCCTTPLLKEGEQSSIDDEIVRGSVASPTAIQQQALLEDPSSSSYAKWSRNAFPRQTITTDGKVDGAQPVGWGQGSGVDGFTSPDGSRQHHFTTRHPFDGTQTQGQIGGRRADLSTSFESPDDETDTEEEDNDEAAEILSRLDVLLPRLAVVPTEPSRNPAASSPTYRPPLFGTPPKTGGKYESRLSPSDMDFEKEPDQWEQEILQASQQQQAQIPKILDWDDALEREIKSSRLAELTSVQRAMLDLRELTEQMADESLKAAENLRRAEDAVESVDQSTKDATVELAKASKSRSRWWGMKASSAGIVGGTLIGLGLGPIGVVAGASIGGAVGLVAGKSARTRHETQMNQVIREMKPSSSSFSYEHFETRTGDQRITMAAAATLPSIPGLSSITGLCQPARPLARRGSGGSGGV